MEKDPVKIIFDTDIGGDCDDAGALALLHSLCEKGEAELLAVTGCYATPYLAGGIDAINTHYGRRVPVGILHDRFDPRDRTEGYNGYDKSVAEHFPHSFPDWRQVPDSVRLIRQKLEEAADGEITLVATGPLTTLGRLVLSGPDEVSPLSGKELIEKKIRRTVVMGGRFFGTWPFEFGYGINTPHVTAEWNIYADIPAAQTVTDRKLRNIRMADSAGKITSAEISREPTRFMASTMITAMTMAISRFQASVRSPTARAKVGSKVTAKIR